MLVPSRLAIGLSFLVACLIFVARFSFKVSTREDPSIVTTITNHRLETCEARLDGLKELSVDYPIKYARRNIIINPRVETERASVTMIDAPLIPDTQVIDFAENSNVKLEHCMEPLVLDVHQFPKRPVDASHVFFGMATDLDRLDDSIVFIQRWLAYTNARLFAIVVGSDRMPPDSERMADTELRMRGLGMEVTIAGPLNQEDAFSERVFSLVKLMYSHLEPSTKWISIIDDDTFFPSMHSLIAKLATYDPKQQWYLGGMSEEWWAVVHYGLMGFGGGGLFLSIPLAAVLDEHSMDCKEKSGAGAGDMRIAECINWHTKTKLTHVAGLHQIDMHGDLSGLFESGWLPLSLHHWKGRWWDKKYYGDWIPMAAMHLVADLCGDCFLQRWQFGSDMLFSNGYSIATYAKGVLRNIQENETLDMPEYTWNEAGQVNDTFNPGWDHYIGPLRPKLKLEEDKIQYRFLNATAVDGGVRQFYIHLGVDGDLDTLLELFWTR